MECFSAVDAAVEKRILEALLGPSREMTLLFASHRLSVMPRMDEIWVMEQGTIHARGTHGSLLDRSETYRLLWHRSEKEPLPAVDPSPGPLPPPQGWA